MCHQAAAATAGEAEKLSATETLALQVSAGKLIRLKAPAARIFVADPAIADIQAPGPASIFVFGKKPGRTTLFALASDGHPILTYTLDVRFSEEELASRFRAEAGDLPVKLAYTPNGALLEGTVPNAAAAARLEEAAGRWVGAGEPLINQLRITASTQINLRVRVAEVSRSVSRTLGFNWNTAFSVGSFSVGLATGRLTQTGESLIGNGVNGIFGAVATRRITGQTVLDAMAEEGLVTMLAEPNLTAVSGETASFLAGGEIPIPVPQALGVTSIEYHPFGVSLAFTPTVLGSGMISIKVRPEVSSISTANEVSLGSGTVPAFVTRRAETTVELASGQSFAIAGLIQNNAQNNVQKVPLLGDIPVLGQLFRSNQFQRDETELMIVVTPYLVRPTDPDQRPVDATEFIKAPSDLERLLLSRVAVRRNVDLDPATLPHLRGQAGFLFE
jgi:pilus assembly protein CpaC